MTKNGVASIDEKHTPMGIWEVGMTPAKRIAVVGGLPIPKPTMMMHYRRQIAVEILTSAEEAASKNDDELRDEDRVVLRIFKRKKEDDDDDDETEGKSNEEADPIFPEENEDKDDGKVWKEQYQYPSSDVTITSRNKAKIFVELGHDDGKEERDIEFQSEQDADKFEAIWQDLKERAKKRAVREVKEIQEKEAKGVETAAPEVVGKDAEKIIEGTSSSPGADNGHTHEDNAREVNGIANKSKAIESKSEIKDVERESKAVDGDGEPRIKVLVDVVSGSNLPVGDVLEGTTDPYVVVRLEGKELHRTGHISNDRNPIWTINSKSLCLLDMSAKEFVMANELTFVIKDHDMIDSDDALGFVKVPHEEVLEGKGERRGYTVQSYDSKKPDGGPPPKLYVRFKKATEEDIQFMETHKKREGDYGVLADEVYLPQKKRSYSESKKMHKHHSDEELVDADFIRSETGSHWKEDDGIEALKDSTHWVQAGSGNIGTLYFELLGCDNLPSMDTLGSNMDPFACIVYEDSVVNTDVISKNRSPRWMPWMHRAFQFKMAHPATDVLLGIFDHDSAYNPAQLAARVTGVSDLHDAAGRVVIELSKFHPNTTYTLTYPLYYGETKEQRQESQGTVTIRLRMEFPSVRKALLTALSPPTNNVIALKEKSQWSVAHYTTEGAVNDDEFSIDIMTRYLQELQGYLGLVEIVKQALLFVVLWRNHYTVSLGSRSIKLPMHSITAYIWGIKLAWNYNLMPSFFFFSIGWIMLACNEHINRHPSKWHQSPTYVNFLRRLVLDSSYTEEVECGYRANEIKEYNERKEKERKEREEKRRKQQAQKAGVQEEIDAKMQKAENAEDVGEKDNGFLGLGLHSPLKPILYPHQKMMQGYVQKIRLAKNIILWYESYFAFWVTTFAFLASTIAYFVPWGFLLKWTIRILVVVFLGPWMKIVDKKLFGQNPNMTAKEQEEAFKEKMKERYEQKLKATNVYQVRAERATKLSAMRKFMFGKYLLKVPVLHEDLFFDLPSPDSSAKPFNSKKSNSVMVKDWKYGQALEGDMIPKHGHQMLPGEDAKFTKHAETLDNNINNSPPTEKRANTSTSVDAPLLTHQDSTDSEENRSVGKVSTSA